jgi:drug/metabolite transporter (DMT)-like permease
MHSKMVGILSVVLASVVWAMEPVLARLSYRNATVIETTGIRILFVTVLGLVYAFLSPNRSFRINRKQFSVLVYIALAGTIFADLVYFWAIMTIPAINAVLIGHLQPVFIALIGFFILREDRLNGFDYSGILFMIVAGTLVISRTWENLSHFRIGGWGDLLALSATAAWATAGIAMRKYLRDMNSGVITFYRFLIASAFFAGWLLLQRSLRIANPYQVVLGVIVGAGYILYYEGLKRIKAAQAAALELCAPVFAALFGLLFLDEPVTPLQGAGLAILFLGIYCLSKKEEVLAVTPA